MLVPPTASLSHDTDLPLWTCHQSCSIRIDLQWSWLDLTIFPPSIPFSLDYWTELAMHDVKVNHDRL